MVPTVLDALGVEPADADPRRHASRRSKGSASPTPSTTPSAPSKHVTQYFEMFGHRSLYHDGWRAVCPWPGHSFAEGKLFGAPLTADDLTAPRRRRLGALPRRRGRVRDHDVAAENRDQLIEMIALWYVEAGKYNVLPLDSRGTMRLAEQRPQLAKDRADVRLLPAHPGGPGRPGAAHVLNRPHTITADVEIPDGGAEGVLLSMGGVDGGYTFFVKDGKLHYAYNYVAAEYFRVSSDGAVPTGKAALRFEFEPTGPPDIANGKGTPGRAQLYVNGKLVGQAELPVHHPARTRARRRRVRRPRRGLTGVRRLPGAVRVHRARSTG